ncbi:MAG: addiction module protein [Planctomycetaceae bacterium]|nr:addiction module protein [Planctomycetaceae bacterium]
MSIDVDHAIHELKALPIQERLKVVEAVWDSIDEDGSIFSPSPSQRAELDRRMAAHEADPESSLTWDQVLERLRGEL